MFFEYRSVIYLQFFKSENFILCSAADHDHKSPAAIFKNTYMTHGYIQVSQADLEGELLSDIHIHFEHDSVIGYAYFIRWEFAYSAQ